MLQPMAEVAGAVESDQTFRYCEGELLWPECSETKVWLPHHSKIPDTTRLRAVFLAFLLAAGGLLSIAYLARQAARKIRAEGWSADRCMPRATGQKIASPKMNRPSFRNLNESRSMNLRRLQLATSTFLTSTQIYRQADACRSRFFDSLTG